MAVEITQLMYTIYTQTDSYKSFKAACKEKHIMVSKAEYKECEKLYCKFKGKK